jgi:hypothetical protein
MSEYYIPDITEFHVGFEYQAMNMENAHWGICKVEEDFATPPYLYEIENETIRVKYLDIDDIESFGFEYYMENKNQKLHIFYKDNVSLAYDEANNKIKTFTKDPSLNKEYMMTNVDPYLINNIIIKNKSEFKKFLKQINLL